MKIIQRLLPSSAAVVVMVVLALIFGGNLSEVVQANAAGSSDCKVHYINLDGKGETTGSFGPGIVARDRNGVLAEIRERRECGNDKQYDPALAAAHYVDWATATLPNGSPANLTSMKVSWDNATSFAQLLASNKDVYTAAIKELNELENNASFSIESVPEHTPSAYMATDGHGGVQILQGYTAHDGTNAVFTTKSGAVIRYRLECGAQPNWATPRPNLPACAEGQCTPPPPVIPPTPECTENCTPNPCPPGNENPDCAPKSGDKKDYEYPAGKPPVTVTEPGTDSPTPVQTEVPGPVVTDTPTNPPGSETGGQAPDATPAPTNPSPPPPNEGDGTNDGTVPKP